MRRLFIFQRGLSMDIASYLLPKVLRSSFPSVAPSSSNSSTPHFQRLVELELWFLRRWFTSLFLEGKCPAKGIAVKDCPECAKQSREVSEADLDRSKFVQGSTNRVGPHFSEFYEAAAAIWYRLGKIGQLAQE